MRFLPTLLKDAYLIEPSKIADNRGWFSRIYCKEEYRHIDPSIEWIQFNNSFTYKKGTVRGLHFQYEPYSEIKLVRCIAGAVFDVIVDVRKDSPTFLMWYAAELTSENRMMMFVPKGFAHGFQTLTDDCEMLYTHTSVYKTGYEGAIRYDDPTVNIKWPLAATEMSERDRTHSYITKEFKGISSTE